MLTLAIPAARAPLAPKQKRFNQLVAKIGKLKAALQAWLGVRDEIQRRAPDLLRLQDEHRALVRALLLLWDRSWSALTKAERAQLSELISELAWDYLEGGPDGEIKTIFNRHSDTDFDVERAADEAVDVALMRDVLAEHGIEVDAKIDSLDDLEAVARAKLAEHERAAAEAAAAAPPRRKSKRQQTADARRETAQAAASKALQDVYRKLALALHPDRACDDAERARHTVLMAEVNTTYERRDLLALLELQLRFEQLDAAQIAELAEERLDRFNKLLAEQAAQLAQELAEVELPYRVQLEVPPPRKLAPAHVIAVFEDDVRTVATQVADARRDLGAMQDLATLKRMLHWQRDVERRELDEMMRTMEAMAREADAASSRRTRRRR